MAGKLETALRATGFAFAHFAWSHAPDGDFGVWREERGNDLLANDRHVERGTVYSVDLFTRDDSPRPRRAIEAALNGLRCAWRLNSVQYENDTGYVHFEWYVGLYGEA